MNKSAVVKGYKVFHEDFTCYGGFRYEVGKTYTMDGDPVCCERGFHFCVNVIDCFSDYSFDPKNRVAEVEAFGAISRKYNKCCTNGIKIVRELSWNEVLNLVNIGKNCTGIGNSENNNSGDWNSGCNNSGNNNSGYRNSGDRNSGNWNAGYMNSGDCNNGRRNSGDFNSGDYNSGDRNSGNYNCGDCNSGNGNVGDFNSGNFNEGKYNKGHSNRGEHNKGNGNIGDWNICNYSTGCFNTKQSTIKMFDKDSDMTWDEWQHCKAKHLLDSIPKNIEWVTLEDMTDEEKQEHPDYKTTNGYLKVFDETDSVTLWWNNLPDKDKSVIKALPNFDFEIFCKCIGIDKEKAVH